MRGQLCEQCLQRTSLLILPASPQGVLPSPALSLQVADQSKAEENRTGQEEGDQEDDGQEYSAKVFENTQGEEGLVDGEERRPAEGRSPSRRGHA